MPEPDPFADLARGWAAQERAELDVEVADRAEIEVSRLVFADRLRAAGEAQVRLRLLGGAGLVGRLAAVGRDWCALAGTHSSPDAVVLLAAVAAVEGLPARQVGAGSALDMRTPVGVALRELVRDRRRVVVLLRDGRDRPAVLARTGADFVDLDDGGCLPLSAVAAVTHRGESARRGA